MVGRFLQFLNRFLPFTAVLVILFTASCSVIPKLNVIQVSSTNTPVPAKTQMPSFTIRPTATSADTGMVMVTPVTGVTPVNGLTPLVKVSDQDVISGTVKIDEVVSYGPGWIVVYTANAANQPDQPIGHAAVKDGDNKNIIVPVDPAEATGTLFALLHTDVGKLGVFEYPGPDGPVMYGPQMVENSFKVNGLAAAPKETSTPAPAETPTAMGAMANTGGDNSNSGNMNTGATPPQSTPSGITPNIIVANQPIIDGKVTIPEVISNADAWVVVHKRYGGNGVGPMVGFAHVHQGDNRNVVVPLDPSMTSSTMSVMLHMDVSKASSPQFPGPDQPVMVNGQMLNPVFQITQLNNGDIVVVLGTSPDTLNYLVDGSGMTLYLSLQDAPEKSNCTGDCLNTWTPFLATGRIVAGVGVSTNKFGVIVLSNGSRQITYNGSPLYLYTKDQKPGDVNGQGVDGNWYLVSP